MGEKNFFRIFGNRLLLLIVFGGTAVVGFTTGNVIAQEVQLGDDSGSPFISFDDATFPGNKYEIRLNDGSGRFQIYDITNDRSSLIVAASGNVGVGDAANTEQAFTNSCSQGKCNILTKALDGSALNTVKSKGGPQSAAAKFKLEDDTVSRGTIQFEIRTFNDGTVCLGNPQGEKCMLRFDVNGTNPGQVRQADGTCIANC